MSEEEFNNRTKQLKNLSVMLRELGINAINLSNEINDVVGIISNPIKFAITGTDEMEKKYCKISVELYMLANKIEVIGKCMDEFGKEK